MSWWFLVVPGGPSLVLGVVVCFPLNKHDVLGIHEWATILLPPSRAKRRDLTRSTALYSTQVRIPRLGKPPSSFSSPSSRCGYGVQRRTITENQMKESPGCHANHCTESMVQSLVAGSALLSRQGGG
ncbi:hypothetical protein B0I35DRAFT_274154 [Stachybotrys elegans]|uniref:Uncharacterized protein n=1 Tax=Stachybotrys elegans TaxID=80388 RepID=A0A8K0SPD0_9HYPO|nr:hypothetical protein B0I35DRAFT_274154 [Stachybotrys elegans]